jgi:hypothetical protein
MAEVKTQFKVYYFYASMNETLRTPITEDWITIILVVCLLLISVSEYFSTYSFTQSWIRFSKKPDTSMNESNTASLTIPVLGRLVLYSVCISLLLIEFEQYYLEKPINLNKFLSYWVVTCTLFIAAHYLSKLVAHICKFESSFDQITATRNYQRGLLSYVLAITYLWLYYSSIELDITIICTAALVLFTVNYVVLAYRIRWFIFHSPLYFVLYLCALEIAPYLLLYKYVIM